MIVCGNRFSFLPFIVAAKEEGGKNSLEGLWDENEERNFSFAQCCNGRIRPSLPFFPGGIISSNSILDTIPIFSLAFLHSLFRPSPFEIERSRSDFFPLVIVRQIPSYMGKLHDFIFEFISPFIPPLLLRCILFYLPAKVLQAFRKVSLAHFSSLISCPQAQSPAAWWVFHYTVHSNFLPFSFSSTPYDCLDGRGEVGECEKSMKCLLWWPRHFLALPLIHMLALRTLQIILAYLMIDRHSWQLF